MDSHYKAGKLEIIFFILIVMINKIILNLPKTIIQSTGTGAIVNIIYTAIITIILCLIISFLFKLFPNSDIIDLSEYLGGKILKFIIGLAYIIFFGLVISVVVVKLINLLKLVYFPKSPYIYIIMFFLFGIAIANRIGFKGIIKTNFVILPAIIFSLIIIFFGISEHIELNRIYPILGNNIKSTFISGITNIFAYSGVTYLFFIMPSLKNKKDFSKIAVWSIISSALFLLFITTTLIMFLPFLSDNEDLVSVYTITRSVEFGDFLQRTDAMFIFLWIVSAFSYLSISLFFIINIIKKLIHCKKSNELSYSICAILFAVIYLVKSPKIINILENTVYKYYLLILVFGVSTLILLLGNIKKRITKKEAV